MLLKRKLKEIVMEASWWVLSRIWRWRKVHIWSMCRLWGRQLNIRVGTLRTIRVYCKRHRWVRVILWWLNGRFNRINVTSITYCRSKVLCWSPLHWRISAINDWRHSLQRMSWVTMWLKGDLNVGGWRWDVWHRHRTTVVDLSATKLRGSLSLFLLLSFYMRTLTVLLEDLTTHICYCAELWIDLIDGLVHADELIP